MTGAAEASVDLVVGILGGMGPDATVDLMQRIIAATPARDDQEHIRLLVDNNPKVPSRIAALIEETGPSPLPVLVEMARGLEAQGADLLAMPCNTAHHYHAEVAAAVDIPFLNMPELAAASLAREAPQARRVGLLASSALQKIQLYEPWLAAHDQRIVYPEAAVQDKLMVLIGAVKSGGVTQTGTAALVAAARNVEDRGADVLLIACTELSVLSGALSSSLPVFDSAAMLAESVVAHARGG